MNYGGNESSSGGTEPRTAIAIEDAATAPEGEADPSPTRRLRRGSAPVDERRTHQRATLETDVSLYSDTNFWSGYTEDVSEGGLFVAAWQLLPLGTSVEIEVELPTGYRIKTPGEVRWHREGNQDGAKPGMGLRFLELAEADLRAIQTFIKHRAPLFWDEE